ncbi:hypothetical protein [Kitasatospora sp. NPDC047058]|uniref:hypothetical protein n=1 Tax=Kitasatospora sp. NPDC047058 TaxID=3155620 RepID=UPI0033DFB513
MSGTAGPSDTRVAGATGVTGEAGVTAATGVTGEAGSRAPGVGPVRLVPERVYAGIVAAAKAVDARA